MGSQSSTAKNIFFRKKKSIKVKNNQWKVDPRKVNPVYGIKQLETEKRVLLKELVEMRHQYRTVVPAKNYSFGF
jgi:hypothetical protein